MRGILAEELGPRLGEWSNEYLVALFDNIGNIHSEVGPLELCLRAVHLASI